MGATSKIMSILSLVGRPFRQWSEWAAANPEAAAIELEGIANARQSKADELERRGKAAWRVRRIRRTVASLRRQAADLRDRVPGVCSVVPGKYPT